MFDFDITSECKGLFSAPSLADLSHREPGCRGSCHAQSSHKADSLQQCSVVPDTVWRPLNSTDYN